MIRQRGRTYLFGGLICIAMLIIASVIGKKVITDSYIDEQFKVKLYRHSSGEIEIMPLDEYLALVVCAEMPRSFGKEALKAQVVAARTYVVRKYFAGANPNCQGTRKGALLCDDPAHAQAIATAASGAQVDYLLDLVHATDGQILVDDTGRPIDALFHSNCGGNGTAAAKEVWGRDVSYLQKASCGGFHPNKDTTVKITSQELLTKVDNYLGVTAPALKLETTTTNQIKTITLGTTTYQRQILREIFKLPSSTIFASKQGKLITIKSEGAGHGVGMCQYGAKNLADQGFNHKQILQHYYAKTKLKKVKID